MLDEFEAQLFLLKSVNPDENPTGFRKNVEKFDWSGI